MQHKQTRDMVLAELDKMLALPQRHIKEDAFRSMIGELSAPLSQRYEEDSARWNGTDAIALKTAFKANLLLDERWGEAYRICSDEPTPRQLQALHEYVDYLDNDVCGQLVQELEIEIIGCGPHPTALPLVTGRTKNVAGILDKVRRVRGGNRGNPARKDFCVADLPDAVRARIIVENVEELELYMKRIELRFKERIIEKDDFYGNPRKKNHPYRLVTYTVECGGVPAEIQLQSLPSAIAAALDHDIIYKPYVPASLEEREIIQSLQRRVALAETFERVKMKQDKSVELPVERRETSAMRHLFQCTTDTGSCVCAYVSEESPDWREQLRDARSYFQWHESMRAITTHKGSSAMTTSAIIGTPNWQALRQIHLDQIKRSATHIPAIDALVADGADLFVVEALSADVNVDLSLLKFRSTLSKCFTEAEREEVEQVLAVAQEAHAGQSYANDKMKDDGTPAYPSSMLLKDVPYWNHCVQIATLAAECGLSLDAVKAALLHDVIEDTDFDEEKLRTYPAISECTLSMVKTVTKTKDETREEYMARMAETKGEEKLLKALDRYHNLLRAFNLRDNPKYLKRIVDESKDVFMGDFAPNAAVSKYALRFSLLLHSVDRLRQRKLAA